MLPLKVGQRVRVTLTQQDIRDGHKASATDCPFARALKRRLASSSATMVRTVAYAGDTRLAASRRVREAIDSFDVSDGSKMQPGVYYFRVTQVYLGWAR